MSKTAMSARPPVEGLDGISVIRGSDVCRQWNNIEYALGMCSRNVGSKHLSMNVAHIPPGIDLLPQRADAYFAVQTSWRWPWWWPGGGVDWKMPAR